MSSEVLQQRDLLVAERTDFLVKCGDKAEYCAVLPQWHYKQCAGQSSPTRASVPGSWASKARSG